MFPCAPVYIMHDMVCVFYLWLQTEVTEMFWWSDNSIIAMTVHFRWAFLRRSCAKLIASDEGEWNKMALF